MDWFELLTGFSDTDYADTRSKLRVEGNRLQSLVNGNSYRIGELELVSLRTLRDKAKHADPVPGRLKVSVVTGDVRKMHALPQNSGAVFQVASQFNLLEMVGPTITPKVRHAPLPPAPLLSIGTTSRLWLAVLAKRQTARLMV